MTAIHPGCSPVTDSDSIKENNLTCRRHVMCVKTSQLGGPAHRGGRRPRRVRGDVISRGPAHRGGGRPRRVRGDVISRGPAQRGGVQYAVFCQRRVFFYTWILNTKSSAMAGRVSSNHIQSTN